MRIRKHVALLAWIAFTATVAVHAADDHKGHDHEGKKGGAHVDDVKPMYGGTIAQAKDVSYELVAKPDGIALYVTDHGKPVDTKGAAASVTLLSASEKMEVTLSPTGENKLEAKGSYKLVAGTKAVARVSLFGKPAQTVRFAVK